MQRTWSEQQRMVKLKEAERMQSACDENKNVGRMVIGLLQGMFLKRGKNGCIQGHCSMYFVRQEIHKSWMQ